MGIGSRSPDHQLEDSTPEHHKLDDAELHVRDMNDFLSNRFDNIDPQLASSSIDGFQPSYPFNPDFQLIDTQLASLAPNGMQPYDPHLTFSNPPLTSSSHIHLRSYDPHPPMDHWTNKALLSTLQAWQDMIYSGQERYALEHTDFQEIMEELVTRNILSVDWRWTVDIEEVDLALTRAMVEGLGD